jgi:hypothetical protein
MLQIFTDANGKSLFGEGVESTCTNDSSRDYRKSDETVSACSFKSVLNLKILTVEKHINLGLT